MTSAWTLVIAEPAGGPNLAEINDVRGFTWITRLDGPDELTRLVVDGRSNTAGELVDFAVDIMAWRNDTLLHRGRVTAPDDEIGPDRHQLTIGTSDYRWLLSRRLLQADLTPGHPTAIDQEAVGWAIIDHIQSQTGGALGITRDGTATGTTRQRTYAAGDNAGTLLDQLGRVGGGHDWDIGADLVYRSWAQRGGTADFNLEYGGAVTHVRRRPDPSKFANAVRVTGDDTLTPESRAAPDLATATEGRWDAQVGFSNVSESTTLAEHADGELAERSRLPIAWSVTLGPDIWTPDRLAVGDTGELVVDSGHLDVDEVLRVHQLDVEVDLAAGTEKVTAHLDTPPRDAHEFAREIAGDRRRLTELERTT